MSKKKRTAQEFIESCLDVNSSWREEWNDYGCLMAFDYDIEFLGSIIIGSIVEECDISEEDAIQSVLKHVSDNNYTWNKKVIMENFDRVIDTLEGYGGDPEEDFENLDDTELKDFMLAKLNYRNLALALKNNEMDRLDEINTTTDIEEILYYIAPNSELAKIIKDRRAKSS